MTTRRGFLKSAAAAAAASVFAEPRESEAQAVRPTAPRLEDTVRRSSPAATMNIDPTSIQNPYDLFRFLVIEGHVDGERVFATNYSNFVKGMATRLSFVPFDRARLYITPASRIAATMWPGHIFISDLVDASFAMAQESAKYGTYHSSKKEIKLGVNLGREYTLETKPKIEAVVRVAFDNAGKSADENRYYGEDIEFARTVADEYSVNINVHAKKLAERVVKKAVSDVEQGYPHHHNAPSRLNDLQKVAKTLGIDGDKYVGDFFEGVLRLASGNAALNKIDEAKLKAELGRHLAESYAPAYVPKFDAFIGKLK